MAEFDPILDNAIGDTSKTLDSAIYNLAGAGDWILETGNWNDGGFWDDTATWNDGS